MPRQKKDPHFRAARLKLERARTHLAELERTVTEFVVSNPITVTTKLEGEAFMFYADLNRDFPRHFPGILGDIIHNLRASLDLLASELVRMNGGNDSHTYFPFAESADKLEEQIKNRNMHPCCA